MQHNIPKYVVKNNPPIASTTDRVESPPKKLHDQKKSFEISTSAHISKNEVITEEKIFAELRLSLLKQQF
jgi:hypothetical protein